MLLSRTLLLKDHPKGILHSLEELFALANAMENEAARKYEELATAMAERYLANPALLGDRASLQAWAKASAQYKLINNHREDQAPISARVTALTEAKLRSAGVPVPHR